MSRTVRENLNPNVRSTKEPISKPVSRITRPSTTTTRPPVTTRPTAVPRLATAAAMVAKPSQIEIEREQQAKEWKDRVAQMENVVGQLANQVTLLTEQLSTSNRQKDQLEQAMKEVQGVGQALQQYAQQPLQVQYQTIEVEEPQAEPEQAQELEEEPSSSEEEPDVVPPLDTSIFTEELQKINLQRQEIMKQNAEADMAHRMKMESLDFELKRTQIAVDSAQSQLQTIRNENTSHQMTIGQKEAEVRKLTSEMKATGERLTEECQAIRQRLTGEINQTKKKYEGDTQTKKSTLEATSRKKETCLEKIQQLQEIARKHQEIIDALEAKAFDAEQTRKKLCSDIQDLKGSVRVLCRVKPQPEGNDPSSVVFEYPESNPMELLISANGQKSAYHYDRVFPPSASHLEIFSEVSYLVENTFEGKNSCIFCYGQSGSGKSMTCYGNEQEKGLIHNIVSQVISLSQAADWEYTLEVSFFEIRNEKLNDLVSGKEDLQIKQIKNGLTEIIPKNPSKLASVDDLHRILEVASKSRSYNPSHNVHCIFQLGVKGKNKTTKAQKEAILNLVELNQSEKHKQNEDPSLFQLGNVFGALCMQTFFPRTYVAANNSKSVPWKESKLTEFLQNSIGGDSKALMIVHLSQLSVDYKNTLNSLQFASKVCSCEIGNGKKSHSK